MNPILTEMIMLEVSFEEGIQKHSRKFIFGCSILIRRSPPNGMCRRYGNVQRKPAINTVVKIKNRDAILADVKVIRVEVMMDKPI